MFCKYCGAQVPEQAQFCVRCGAKVNRIAAAKQNVKKRTPIVIIIVVLALCVACVGAGLCFREDAERLFGNMENCKGRQNNKHHT